MMISEFALFVFTTLGGLGAGLYIAATITSVEGKKKNLAVSIIPLVCLAIGGVALILHLGHPERMLNVLRNPAAGITQEGIVTGLFGFMLLIDLICTWRKGETPRAVRIVGSVFGVVLCFIMGNAYFAYESVPVWHTVGTFLLFLLAALAAGASLLPFVDKEAEKNKVFTVYSIIMDALSVLTFIVECVLFDANGLGFSPFVVSTVLALVAVMCLFFKRGQDIAWRRWATCIAIVVAMVIARYTFYAVI